MARAGRNHGLTLVEMLITIAIVAILATIMAVAVGDLRRQAQIKLTQSTLAVITSSLQQYYEFSGKYPPELVTLPAPDPVLTSIAKAINHYPTPPDPTDIVKFMVINKATMPPVANPTWAVIPPVPATATPNAANVASEALYLYLSGVPVSRNVISKLSDQMLSDETDTKGNPFIVQWTKPAAGSKRITMFIDVWKQPLRYEYKAGDAYPVVVSSGPDMKAGTADDIRSNAK